MTNEAGLEFGIENPLRCKLCGGKGKHRHSYFDDQNAVIKYRTTRATPQPIDAWGNVPEGWTLIPLDAGERLGESFLQILFGPEFDTPYVERLNAVVQTASKLPKPPEGR